MEQVAEPKSKYYKDIKTAMNGRSQRWLSLEIKMAEGDLSKKMNGNLDFTEEDIKSINTVLKSKIKF